MNVELIRYTPEPDELCAQAAGICVGKGGSTNGLIHAIRSGHESVLEHATFTFLVEGVSRVLLAQLIRHRIASFSVLSQRYVQLVDDTSFVLPQSIMGADLGCEVSTLLEDAMDIYEALLDKGVPAEDARYIIPQGVVTDLMVTMNARELRHFFQLRCCNRAQKEIRDLADEMFRQCRKVAPILFGECGPGCVTDRCREARPCGHPRTGDELFY